MANRLIYTIGHSNHQIDDFLNLVQLFNINCIVDVRTTPASAYSPQFNQDTLKTYLKKHNIAYLHLGTEFGARRYDCLDNNNNVNFERAVDTDAFKSGVQRISQGIEKGYNIAFMCSEAQPVECHRFAMVSRYFSEHDFDVKHILKEKKLIHNALLQKEMLAEYVKKKKIPEVDNLFGEYTQQQQIIDAYRIKNKEMAFHAEMEEAL